MTDDGTAAPLDPTVLERVLADGLHWIVAHEDDAARLRAHGFPAICLAGGETLAEDLIMPLTRLIVLQRGGPEEAAFGVWVKTHLQQFRWRGGSPAASCRTPSLTWRRWSARPGLSVSV